MSLGTGAGLSDQLDAESQDEDEISRTGHNLESLCNGFLFLARTLLTRRFSQRPLLSLLLPLVKVLLVSLCISFAGLFVKWEILQHKMFLEHHNLR